MAQLVECLPRKYKALSINFHTNKKIKNVRNNKDLC
jgi:hypothetical protein